MPIAITASAGAIVTSRRSQIGMWRWRKPSMMTCPAIVPTADDDKPAASSDRAKMTLAALPRSGVSVR